MFSKITNAILNPGSNVVYIIDDSDTWQLRNKIIKRFGIIPSQFVRHFAETRIYILVLEAYDQEGKMDLQLHFLKFLFVFFTIFDKGIKTWIIIRRMFPRTIVVYKIILNESNWFEIYS